MKRFIMHATDGTKVNISSTHIKSTGDFVEVYCENELVGMFDKGIIQFCYLSKERNKEAGADNA